MRYRAVVFDFDGLLVDTERISFECWQECARARGYDLSLAIFGEILGRSAAEGHQLLRSFLGEDFPAERVRDEKNILMEQRARRDGIPVRPGAYQLLDFLRSKGISYAIASSTARELVRERMGFAGLQEHFSVVVTGSDVARTKPAPDLFLKALSLLGTSADQTLALEDSDAGVASAHAAGIDVVAIPDLKQPSARTRAISAAVLPSLADVAHFMELRR